MQKILAIVLICAAAGCSDSSSAVPTSGTVRITASGLSRPSVKVALSGAVHFINEDTAPHQIDSACVELDSPVLGTGTDFTAHMAAVEQTCTYQDALNPAETKWHGTVKVVKQSSGGESGGSWIVGANGVVAHPGEDGRSFVLEPAPTTEDLLGLFCFEPRGWAVGTHGVVLLTLDGRNWTASSSGVDVTLRSVAFASPAMGLAVGDGGTVLRSLDGGVTWTPVSSGTVETLRAVDFADNGENAWITGDAGTLLVSDDGGLSFTQAANVPAVAIHGVRFASHDPSNGAAVGDAGTVLVTDDYGVTWTAGDSAPDTLRGLQVTEQGTRIIAVGDGGVVWRSLDSGATWSAGDSGTSNDLRAIGFGENGFEGWAVGPAGTLLHTLDGGETFDSLVSPAAVDLSSVENDR